MTEIVVMAAVILTRAGGAALTLAIAGAMVEALWPGIQNAMAVRVWAWLGSALKIALRLFYLLTCGVFTLAYRLSVTYLHIGEHPVKHRYSRLGAWREGTYSALRPAPFRN